MTKKSPVSAFAENEIDDSDLSELSETELHEAVQVAIAELAAEGHIVDSGRRRWSRRSKQFEIVWMMAPEKMN